MPVGHKDTPRTTPLHVYQLVMQLLRITLSSEERPADAPFVYTDDPRTTEVFLDTEFNKEAKLYGAKPLLIVSRGAVSSNPIALGDLAEGSFSRTLRNKTSLVSSSVEIKTIARHSAEVDLLSQIIYSFLISCRTVLPALTSMHQIQSISLTPVAAYEEDDHMYYTQATFSYVMQYQWTWDMAPVLLNAIGLHINEKHTLDLPTRI
jgi:hypothetical protein